LRERLRFTGATIERSNGEVVIRDLNWTVHEGEACGIVGPSASGKSTLAEAIRGQHRIASGALVNDFKRVGYVAFREESHLFSHARHYHQQRFNFIEPEDDLKLIDFLGDDLGRLGDLPEKLHIAHLLPQSLIQLSNGQLRRARLCKALAARPDLLILDDPFMGIDAQGREELSALLRSLRDAGQQMILIAKGSDLPDWVTNVLHLPDRTGVGRVSRPAPNHTGPDGPGDPSYDPSSHPVVELRNVSVRYGEKYLLRDIDWAVRQGERWGLLGPNGSGKSTLLSLIVGDHPQVYSNDVRLFGNRRGQGESIWEVKARIGFVSPELHLYFSEPLQAHEVVASGFFDVLVKRKVNAEQESRLRQLFAQFDLEALWNRPFRHLATGQQRLLLFLRAVVKTPRLLILDEPFQGLDEPTVVRIRDWLDTHLTPEQTLVFVTHYSEEMPRCVSRILRLDEGKIG
jgi:molybdate transport system ATP-binding protein